MPRPKKPNRADVRTHIVTLKLTAAEVGRLAELVDAREQELRKMTGQLIELTASAYLRWLMEKDAVDRGVDVVGRVNAARVRRKSPEPARKR